MMTRQVTKQQFAAWLAEDEKKSSDALYQEIINDIQEKYNHEITNIESHTAARDLIGFCQKIVESAKNQRAKS